MSKGKILALMGALALLLIALVASGCGGQASGETPSSKLTQDKYAQITVGMTSDQLKGIAGEPSRTEEKSMGGGHSMGDGSSMDKSMKAEYWYFQGDKGWVRIEVADGKVSSKSGY